MFMVNWCSPRSQGNSDGETVVFSTMELEKLSISYKKKKKTDRVQHAQVLEPNPTQNLIL